MLFKSNQEIQRYVVVSAEYELAQLQPYLHHQAEPEFIIPHISQALFNKLQTAVDNNNFQAEGYEELIDRVRFPAANYAFALYLVHNQTKKTKAGVHIEVGENRKTAFQWQINDERCQLLEASWKGMERLLEFLEINKAKFPEWTSSSSYTEFKGLFVANAVEFSSLYNINCSRRLYTSLKAIMQEVEETRIKAVISPELFDEIKYSIASGTLTAEDAKLLQFIKRAVVNYSIAQACIHLPVRMTAEGIHLLATSLSENLIVLTPAEKDSLSAIIADRTAAGERDITDLQEFIYQNIEDYPTFQESSTYVNPDTDNSWDQSESGVVLF